MVADPRRLRDAHIHDHFGTLLVLLVATFIASGFAEFRWARGLTGLLELMMLAVAFFTTHTRGAKPVALVLGVVGLLGIGVTLGVQEDVKAAHGVVALIITAIYFAILIAVFRRVLQQRHVTIETILGALCVYFVVGLLFSNIYFAIDSLSVLPIFGHPVPRSDYSYFSFITLTTVGYGDITAATDIGRRFAVIEAMSGQIFLATAVARLVALYGVDLRSEEVDDALEAERHDHDDAGTSGGAGVAEADGDADTSDTPGGAGVSG